MVQIVGDTLFIGSVIIQQCWQEEVSPSPYSRLLSEEAAAAVFLHAIDKGTGTVDGEQAFFSAHADADGSGIILPADPSDWNGQVSVQTLSQLKAMVGISE